jgi:hypothetical protein
VPEGGVDAVKLVNGGDSRDELIDLIEVQVILGALAHESVVIHVYLFPGVT